MSNGESTGGKKTRIVIIGGVAGGASAAARARRLDERASIVVIERGNEPSFANCGLPYYIGGEIAERSKLLVAGDRQLKMWLNLDIRTRSEVTAIDRQAREIAVRELDSNRTYRESYDYLIISTGAAPIRPATLLKKVGNDHPRVLSLRNLADADRMKDLVDSGVRSAVVVGGGFIGLEVAEQLVRRRVTTTLVERFPQVMPQLDAEMVTPLHEALARGGVQLHLGDGLADLEPRDSQIAVVLDSGKRLMTDLVVLAIGVRPESELADQAGLALTGRGAIRVDDAQRTSDPFIYAVGDAVEVTEPVLGGKTFVPLGGPAGRQGRLAADCIVAREGSDAFANERLAYRGSQGTSIVRVFELAAAMTGLTEKALAAAGKRRGTDYDVVFAHPNSHAGYYPGAQPVSMKLIYEKPAGRVLGVQCVGKDGVDKRVDVVSMAIQMRATVFDLEQVELCYAPPFGSAKDPVNMVGFLAANALRGLTRPICADELRTLIHNSQATVVDVRTAPEVAAGALPSAMHVPLEELRGRIREIPGHLPVVVYCRLGQRGYLAERILRQHGFRDVRNLSGGYVTWQQYCPTWTTPSPEQPRGDECKSKAAGPPPCETRPSPTAAPTVETLDARGLQCPGPLIALAKRVAALARGAQLRVLVSDPGFTKDAAAWCKTQGHAFLGSETTEGYSVVSIEAGCGGREPVPSETPSCGGTGVVEKGQTIVVFSGDMDRVLAAFVIANGAAAMGHPVTMFFTFWGLNVLRKGSPPKVAKKPLDRMFGWMMPRGAENLVLSKMNMAGLGTAMMKHVMRTKGVAGLPELIEEARRQGVRLVACTMSMDVMGIQAEELVDGLEFAGVGTYIGAAQSSRMNLFI